MTRTRRLERIVALAELKRRQASQKVAESRLAHDSAQDKLAQFRGYHDEYTRAAGPVDGLTSAHALRDQRRFVEQIERTVDALDQQAQKSAARYREDVRRWQRETHRRDALDGVLDKARRRAAEADEQRQQREIDDRGFCGDKVE